MGAVGRRFVVAVTASIGLGVAAGVLTAVYTTNPTAGCAVALALSPITFWLAMVDGR
jgi:hypothetical protein